MRKLRHCGVDMTHSFSDFMAWADQMSNVLSNLNVSSAFLCVCVCVCKLRENALNQTKKYKPTLSSYHSDCVFNLSHFSYTTFSSCNLELMHALSIVRNRILCMLLYPICLTLFASCVLQHNRQIYCKLYQTFIT